MTESIESAIGKVAENLVEREEEAIVVVLGMISSEHVLLLGSPGTGKSELGRRLSTICGGNFFQYLMTRFSTPEEIFGPLSLKALENDEYVRITKGYLPTSSVAFLDEIFKANSAILNTLLTILNERQFDNGSGMRVECPIKCVVGASNELPESEELDALYDRFLLRKEVSPVSDDGLLSLLSSANPGRSSCDETADCQFVFSGGLENAIDTLENTSKREVEMGSAPVLMRDLRSFIQSELDSEISDRRLVKAARLLRIVAASHGRTRVEPLDCLAVLQHALWTLPEHRGPIKEWLLDHLTPGAGGFAGQRQSVAAQSRILLDGLAVQVSELVRKTSGDISGKSGARPAEVEAIKCIAREISNISSLLERTLVEIRRHTELLSPSGSHLFLTNDDFHAVGELLRPRAESVLADIENVLLDTRCLEYILSNDENAIPIPNEVRLPLIEAILELSEFSAVQFTFDELNMDMRDAKKKFDVETFRAWKRARKKSGKIE